jgi:hypothetical protein
MPGLSKIDSNALGNEDTGNVTVGPLNPAAYGGKLSVTNSGQASMFLWNSGIGSGHVGFAAASSNLKLYNTYADGLLANGKGIDIDTVGRVTYPNQPVAVVGFTSTYASYTWAGNANIVPDVLGTNSTAGFYSTSTGRFTAPVAGWYHIFLSLMITPSNTNSNRLVLRKNDADYNIGGAQDVIQPAHSVAVGSATQSNINLTAMVKLNAGDYLSFAARSGTSVGPVYGGHSWGFCYLVC